MGRSGAIGCVCIERSNPGNVVTRKLTTVSGSMCIVAVAAALQALSLPTVTVLL
jgi:hypothetical protein